MRLDEEKHPTSGCYSRFAKYSLFGGSQPFPGPFVNLPLLCVAVISPAFFGRTNGFRLEILRTFSPRPALKRGVIFYFFLALFQDCVDKVVHATAVRGP